MRSIWGWCEEEKTLKILFLHLSDLHIQNMTNSHLKVEKIVKAVQSVSAVDKYILICSGDLAFSGLQNEYKSVKNFFGLLLSKLGEVKNDFIESFIVPGNHDMILTPKSRSSSDIIDYFKNKEEDKAFEQELKHQGYFFEYANSKGCFVNNRIVDTKLKNYSGFIIQFNLINTAPFSTLKEDNKEIHYLPDHHLYSLVKQDKADLVITIMHHSTEWFHWKTKPSLEKNLKNNSDIVFQGHEHNVLTVHADGYLLSKGGEFSGAMTHKSTFSVLVFDTESKTCDETQFEWNEEQTIFSKINGINTFAIARKNKLIPKVEFLQCFLEDTYKLSKSVLDYFVFPKLYIHGNDPKEDEKLIGEDEFWVELFERKIINISGKNGTGKTTLLKYLFNKSIEKDMTPLYLSNESCPAKFHAEKILKNLFEEQYCEQRLSYEKYEQEDFDKKILFIDDFDFIKHEANRNKLIEAIKEKVAYIVFTSKEKLELDIITSTQKKIEPDSYFSLKIEYFYKEKRTELVHKICELPENNNSIPLAYIVEVIDQLVARRHGLFELSPAYIVQYIKYFLSKDTDDRKGEAVFNVVFETNIRNAIIEHSSEAYIDYCLLVLEEIAFFVHKNKNELILYKDIVLLVDLINESRGLQIDIEKCLNVVTLAKIIKKTNENNVYEFYNCNYLAYFIAKKLNKLIEKNGLNIPELNYIFTNICFGINDNILLFLSFLRENTAFALNICDVLDSILNEYPELNFDQSNISFIKRQRETAISMPTTQEKKELEKSKDSFEKHRRERESEEIQFKRIYDYDETDAEKFQNKIIRAIKYLEIISKSLISHHVNLELSEKKRIVELMYSAPNRILYAIFKPYDEQYENIINELFSTISAVQGLSKLSKGDIEEAFNRSAIGISLGLYDNIAFFGTNNNTLRLLNDANLLTSNYKIANLIMEENGGTADKFVNKAIKLKEDENDGFITNLIRFIVKKHLISRSVDFKTRDRIADKIFSPSSKKQLLISSLGKENKKE